MVMRRWLVYGCALALAVMAGVVYFAFDPSQAGFFPRCTFLTLTGYKCPGCGSQRALHALLHGDIAAAWQHNAALLVAIPVVAVYLVGELKRTTWPRFYRAISHPWLVYTILAAIILWWVGRNIF